MRQVSYTNGQYLDAPTLNLCAQDSYLGTAEGDSVLKNPGLLHPEAVYFGVAGMVLTANMPSPFAVQFGSGYVSEAHGTVNGQDTQSLSIDLTPYVPVSSSVLVYITLGRTQIQQTPVAIVGPPPGNPAFNPGFVAFNAYTELVDSLNLSASTGVPDGVNNIELARTTLTPGQTSLSLASISTVYQQRAAQSLALQTTPVFASSLLTAANAGYNILITQPGVTLTLPPVSTVNGLVYFFSTSSYTGLSTIKSNGSDVILGVATPSGTTTSISLSGSVSIALLAAQGQWIAIQDSPNFLLGQANTWIAPQTFTDLNGLGGAIISASSTNGAALKLAGNGNTTPNKWIRVTNGFFQVLNNAYSAAILNIDDSGNVNVLGNVGAQGGIYGNSGNFTGNVNASNGTFSGTLQGAAVNSTGNMNAAGTYTGGAVTVNGNVQGATVDASNGNVTANGGYLRASNSARQNPSDGNAAALNADFQLSANGSFWFIMPRLGGALLIQGGTGALGIGNVAFPLAFPNACLTVVCTEGAANPPSGWEDGGSPSVHGVGGFTNTYWVHYSMVEVATGGSTAWNYATLDTNWIAIGY